MNRRAFLATTGAAIAAAAAPASASPQPPATPQGKARFRTGLVAYSYRQALQAKTLTYEDLIRIAVETGTDGLDMTVYWMPSTGDDYLLPLRRLAYKNRVEIYSIGTRVRLAQPTPELREKELVELRKWVDVAQKLGATHVRVFGGQKPEGATLEQAIGFAAETLKRGAEYSGARGIILGQQDTPLSAAPTRWRPRLWIGTNGWLCFAGADGTGEACDSGVGIDPQSIEKLFATFVAAMVKVAVAWSPVVVKVRGVQLLVQAI